ncbi:MAG: hypothetical protein QF714_00955 [Dehalococcoidia bacterium]|jgi:hypothetical protein|nr:hypothetical protein [Dehalococcoidia bacterium]MDP6226267.1 hypothetical protein [Dehalococcoidia bacterium]MDP7083484.1 hypothetical protein [Dehalococcoidia bacterium]MDP7199420.1 hypothetical protein [Dehalococcoidia bacterium]MDP7509474.1 hypothetical protein [Dehalococcoidia bacterium]
MAAKKGRGLLMVYADVRAEDEDEFNRWYNEEHIPERLAIPGVLDAARYVAVQGGPKYLAYYELDEAEAYFSDAWQYRLNNPTEWTKRMSPSVVGINAVRNVYRLIYPDDVSEETAQAGMAPALVVGRMSVTDEVEALFNQEYNTERIPLCSRVPGYIRGRRFEAVMGEPKYITLHEVGSAEVRESQAWHVWRNAAPPQWSETVRPQMTHAPGSPGVYTRIFPA